MKSFGKGFRAKLVLILTVSFLATGIVSAEAAPKRRSLRKPLITAEQKDKNRLVSAAVLLKLRQDLIDKRFLAERFDNYATTIRSSVNLNLDTYVIAVGGTGPNISAPLLDTFFTKAYFIDVIEFSVDKLKKWHEPNNWQLCNASPRDAYFTYKRFTGWIDTNTFEKNPEERLILELKALGVNREDVKIDTDDKDRPVVEFKLPGDNKTRKIVFIHQDLLNLDKGLHSELKGKIDAYHQKGTLKLTNSYSKYVSSISEWIKPGGFLILNNYDTGDQFKDPYPYINKQFMHYSDNLESLFDATFKYGWKMSLYQKVQLPTNIAEINKAGEASLAIEDDFKPDILALDAQITALIASHNEISSYDEAANHLIGESFKAIKGEQERLEKVKLSALSKYGKQVHGIDIKFYTEKVEKIIKRVRNGLQITDEFLESIAIEDLKEPMTIVETEGMNGEKELNLIQGNHRVAALVALYNLGFIEDIEMEVYYHKCEEGEKEHLLRAKKIYSLVFDNGSEKIDHAGLEKIAAQIINKSNKAYETLMEKISRGRYVEARLHKELEALGISIKKFDSRQNNAISRKLFKQTVKEILKVLKKYTDYKIKYIPATSQRIEVSAKDDPWAELRPMVNSVEKKFEVETVFNPSSIIVLPAGERRIPKVFKPFVSLFKSMSGDTRKNL